MISRGLMVGLYRRYDIGESYGRAGMLWYLGQRFGSV